jgi:hypothetical protein
MPNGTPSARLSVEQLEQRTVPTSFGANTGLSIVWANVIPTTFGGDEYVTGSGPGAGARSNFGAGPRLPGLVQIWDRNVQRDSQGTPLPNGLFEFQPFGNYRGGINLAAGNVDSDNETELICATAAGSTGRVKVFEFGFGGLQQVAAFTPFGPNFTGGVEVAVGNTSGGRSQEIVVGQQMFGSLVKVYTGVTTNNDLGFFEVRRFRPFGAAYFGGVSVTAANADTTRNTMFNSYDFNYAEVIVGKASEESRVSLFDVQEPTVDLRGSFLAFGSAARGVNVVAGSTDGQRGAEIYVNLRGTGRVAVFNGSTGTRINIGGTTEFNPTPLFQPSATFGTVRSVNMAVRNNDDDFLDIYSIADLAVVWGDGPFNQIPVIYTGAFNKPAGFNGGNPVVRL